MRFAAPAFALALIGATPQALAAPMLNAMRQCPASGAYSACLQVNIFANAGDKVSSFTGPAGWQNFVKLWGRLDGGAQAEYLVKTYDAREDTDRSPSPQPNAYLGRSEANKPLILTDQGVLEITSEGFDLAFTNYVLVDAVNWKVAARFFKIGRGVYIFTSGQPAGVWDAARNLCVSAPTNNPGRWQADAKRCAARPKRRLEPEEEDETHGDLAPEATTLARIRQVLPELVTGGMGPLNRKAKYHQDGSTGVRAFRIKGTRHLLIHSYYIDNC